MQAFSSHTKIENERVASFRSPGFAPSESAFAPTDKTSPANFLHRKASCACGGGCPSCETRSGSLKISKPTDAAEIEADAIADRVMRMPNDRTPSFNEQRSKDNSIPRVKTDPAVMHRQGGAATAEEPDPLTEGLSTVTDNLSENNPAFSEFTDDLADRFLSQPAALSVGVPVFLGANYAFLWGMAMANPAMRRHFNDFNIALLPGIIPQFPIKTFTYRILNDQQTQFEFDFGLDASALMEAFNEGVLNTHVSTLAFESSGRLNTEGSSPVSLSALQVNLGLFDDGLMLSGGFRQGISPYPLMERNALTGETSQIGAQFPAMPDLFPERQDVRFMLQLDVVRLYNYFNPTSAPIRSVPQQVEGDTVDRPLQRKQSTTESSEAPFRAVPSSDGRPLDRETRSFFEPRIGHDLTSVRIHTGDAAAESARAVNARAYTLGSDIVFGSGEYSPETESGKHLLAHELVHTTQQDNQSSVIRRTPIFGTGTDRIHGDLLDQYARETGQARDTVTQHDPGYEAWILGGAFSVNQATYLGLINSAIGRMSGNLVDNETLATTVMPILRAMAGNPVWKNARGTASGGSSISHTIGATTLNLTLILNDSPDPLRPAGLFNHGTSATDASIEVFIRKNTTIEDLMQTLYHESMHMASWLINRPTSALGVQAAGRSGPRGAAATLDLARSTTQINSVRLWLDTLAQSVNARRATGAQITAANLDQMARWLVEEVNVRIETEVFRLAEETQGFLATRGPLVFIQPGPNWQINTAMVDRYVFDFSQVFLPTDRAGLTAVDRQTLATLLQILEGIYQSRVRRRFQQAPYLVGRGIPRAPFTYTPPPLAPPTFRPLPLP
jgi:hypothetical protein